MATGRSNTRLCLVVAADSGRDRAELLRALLSAADVSSVIIEPALGQSLSHAAVKPLVEAAQRVDAAALVAGDAEIARAAKADGVHLPWSKTIIEDYAAVRAVVGPASIAGGDIGHSRHDAMTLGEAGADYVGFGIPADARELERARERRLDLIAWWAEIFEVPSVAFDVADAHEAAMLAKVGADFVCVSVPSGVAAADVRAQIIAIAQAIGVRAVP